MWWCQIFPLHHCMPPLSAWRPSFFCLKSLCVRWEVCRQRHSRFNKGVYVDTKLPACIHIDWYIRACRITSGKSSITLETSMQTLAYVVLTQKFSQNFEAWLQNTGNPSWCKSSCTAHIWSRKSSWEYYLLQDPKPLPEYTFCSKCRRQWLLKMKAKILENIKQTST